MKNLLIISGMVLGLTGCWTFNETAYPSVQVERGEGAAAITLTGFESFKTDYEAVSTVRTVYVPGYHGHHRYHPGYYETYPTISYVPHARPSDAYLRRAQDAFECAGFTMGTTNAEYLVDVSFEGPFSKSGDTLRSLGWQVLTLFLCDYDVTRWTAKLRIREAKTGKLLFGHDYDQTYETNVIGVVPLFSIASCDKTSYSAMTGWCLTALTDRAIADAAAFLAHRK